MSEAIRLIIGLGNPGPQYETTRHNAGFWMVDHYADELHTQFTQEKSFFSWVAIARYQQERIVLAKPTTFMNKSGQATGALLRFYKLKPEELLVIHDELDLPPGQAKLKLGGGHAGHNGLRDIQSVLGSANFWRLRLGIGHPRTLGLAQQVAGFVLNAPAPNEQEQISHAILRCQNLLPYLLKGEFDTAVSQLHAGNR